MSPLPASPPESSNRPGMGAIVYDGGVTFRVWTKFADAVSVVGDFNNWTPGANPLARDGFSDFYSADVSGATVDQAYKFHITNHTHPLANPFRMDPYASSVFQNPDGSVDALIVPRDTPYEGAGYQTPPWSEAVLYELHIPTFSTQPDGSPGTFASALTRLPALVDLGINAIELLPLGEFVGIGTTGYNPGYIFAVEDTFGGPDGFRTFVNECHALGLAVIVDVVYNHTTGLDLWQFDGWADFNARCSFDPYGTDGGIYFFQDSRAHTPYSHARFDLGRPEVCQYLFDNAMRWLKDRFVDGLRFDSTTSIRSIAVTDPFYHLAGDVPEGRALLRRVNAEVAASQPWKLTIAEDLQAYDKITAPLDDPEGFGFGAQWNDNFCWKVRDAATAVSDDARNISALAEQIALLHQSGFTSVVYSENHDKDDPGQGASGRLPAIIGAGQADSWFAKKLSTLAAAVVLTAPGIPMLFQGQEFLEYRGFPTNGPNPGPIDWGRQLQYAGIWTLYRDLIRLRRNWFDNTRGLRGQHVHVLPVFDNMLVLHRWDQGGPGDDVVIVCNFAIARHPSYAIGLPRPGLWRVRFNSDTRAYDGFIDDWPTFDTSADGPALNGMPASANLSIGAYTCIILSQD